MSIPSVSGFSRRTEPLNAHPLQKHAIASPAPTAQALPLRSQFGCIIPRSGIPAEQRFRQHLAAPPVGDHLHRAADGFRIPLRIDAHMALHPEAPPIAHHRLDSSSPRCSRFALRARTPRGDRSQARCSAPRHLPPSAASDLADRGLDRSTLQASVDAPEAALRTTLAQATLAAGP